jgi:hypothetical protein
VTATSAGNAWAVGYTRSFVVEGQPVIVRRERS